MCQLTDTCSSLSEKGLFMICLLTRLVNFTGTSICREILKILMVRISNYIIVKTNEFEAEEDCDREISLTEDDFLNEQMDFVRYVLKKGILRHELAQG